MEGPDEAPPLSVEEDSFVTVQDGDEAAPHTAANGEGRCDGLEHSDFPSILFMQTTLS
jgi:hypothetical protein